MTDGKSLESATMNTEAYLNSRPSLGVVLILISLIGGGLYTVVDATQRLVKLETQLSFLSAKVDEDVKRLDGRISKLDDSTSALSKELIFLKAFLVRKYPSLKSLLK